MLVLPTFRQEVGGIIKLTFGKADARDPPLLTR